MAKKRASSSSSKSKATKARKNGSKDGSKKFSSKSPKEVLFDPKARQEYLQGFSKRKRERRYYGLAMQKVKDRKERLEKRAETRQAMQQQVEEAEKQKEEIIQEYLAGLGRDPGNNDTVNDDDKSVKLEKIEMYDNAQVQTHWGGAVVVKVSNRIPGDSDDENDELSNNSDTEKKDNDNNNKKIDTKRSRKRRKTEDGTTNTDTEQAYAGNVQRFIAELYGKHPKKAKSKNINSSVSNSNSGKKRKGKHGATQMDGMAQGKDFKTARKMLAQSESKSNNKRQGKKKR